MAKHERFPAAALFGATAVVILAGLASAVVEHVFHHDYVFGLVPLFDLNAEANLPTWFSCLLLAASATLAGLVAADRFRAHEPRRGAWVLLAGVLAFFSLDEIASIHESLDEGIHAVVSTGGVLFYAWIVPGAIFVAVLAFMLSGLVREMPATIRRRFLLGAGMYFGGAIGVEMIGGYYESTHGTRDTLSYALIAAVEESLEMFGAVVVLLSLLALARAYPRPLIRFGGPDDG
ncbi:hypothetical protein K8I61_07310 [bacterium]|nr:hypothetical protein [bacterium]